MNFDDICVLLRLEEGLEIVRQTCEVSRAAVFMCLVGKLLQLNTQLLLVRIVDNHFLAYDMTLAAYAPQTFEEVDVCVNVEYTGVVVCLDGKEDAYRCKDGGTEP